MANTKDIWVINDPKDNRTQNKLCLKLYFIFLHLLFVLTQKEAKKSRLHKNILKPVWIQAGVMIMFRSMFIPQPEQHNAFAPPFQKSRENSGLLTFVAFLEPLLNPDRFFTNIFIRPSLN